MQVTVTFKTPDAIYHALRAAAPADENAVEAVIRKFVKYGETIQVQFDTEAGTATVLPL